MALLPPILPPVGNFPPFPPTRGEGQFPSAGDIDIWWREPDAVSVFRWRERRQNTYHFFGVDQGTTVWRGAPVVLGSEPEIHGVPIGPAGSEVIMSSAHIRRLPQTAIPPRSGSGARRRILAELHSLRMKGQDAELLAGEPFFAHLRDELRLNSEQIAQIFRRSYGEVVSWDQTGDVTRDFPADNHFNVFFAVKFDATSTYPAFTVFNKDPVVVVDLGITGLPPLGRVTIPQFPHDMPRLYSATDPHSVVAAGGCCAHRVAGVGDLQLRPVNFDELAENVGAAGGGVGLDLRTGASAPSGQRMATHPFNRALFRKISNRYVDGVFVPNGVTQITSTGITFGFEDTSAGAVSDAIRNGMSVVDENGEASPIHVESPTDALAYQPPQSFGLGLGPNGGITFDIDVLRRDNPDFYLVNLIALEGMSRESPQGSSVRLRVLVDGVEVPFTSRVFQIPGTSNAVSVDLQTANRFVTLAATSTASSGHGVFALFQLRGFGRLAGDEELPYSGPARPPR